MKVLDFPKRIEIEFSNICNSKCAYCPRRFGVGEEGFISLALFKRIIDEAREHRDVVLQLHRRGESLSHPEFIGMLNYIKDKFKEIQLATNALLLDKKKAEIIAETVNFISFSIDLPDKYYLRRGIDAYCLVEENIINFLKINKRAKTQVSMVKNSSVTETEIREFKELWIDKVDRVRVYEEHSIGGVYGATGVRREKRVLCVKPFSDMVIYYDGRVVRCNHDWSNVALGDVNENAIYQVWNNSEFGRIRREQSSLEFTDNMCQNCDSWYSQEATQDTGYLYSSNSSATKENI